MFKSFAHFKISLSFSYSFMVNFQFIFWIWILRWLYVLQISSLSLRLALYSLNSVLWWTKSYYSYWSDLSILSLMFSTFVSPSKTLCLTQVCEDSLLCVLWVLLFLSFTIKSLLHLNQLLSVVLGSSHQLIKIFSLYFIFEQECLIEQP